MLNLKLVGLGLGTRQRALDRIDVVEHRHCRGREPYAHGTQHGDGDDDDESELEGKGMLGGDGLQRGIRRALSGNDMDIGTRLRSGARSRAA